VFAYWAGNGDMHLKNLTLAADREGRHLLSPVYDQVNTAVYPDLDANLALPLSGNDRHVDRPAWIRFADVLGIPTRAAERVLSRPASLLSEARTVIDESYLPKTMQPRYADVLEARSRVLAP